MAVFHFDVGFTDGDTDSMLKRLVYGSMMSPRPPARSQMLAEVESVLRKLVPPGWTVSVDREPIVESGWRPDVVVSVVSPTDERVAFVGARTFTGAVQLTGFSEIADDITVRAGDTLSAVHVRAINKLTASQHTVPP